MKANLVTLQVFTGLILLIIAGDLSAMDGRWAHQLGIPLSGFARYSFWLVPAFALVPCVLPSRKPLSLILIGDALALAVAVFPIALFSLGTHSVLVLGKLGTIQMEQLHAALGFPVIICFERDRSRIYFSRTHEPYLIRDALRRYSTQPNP